MSEIENIAKVDPVLAGKYSAARHGCKLVENNMIVGLGSGSTAELFVELLAQRKLSIQCVATSEKIGALAQKLGLRLVDHLAWRKIDLTIDGADEIDGKLNLIKGLGGAFLSEKIIARFSERLVIIADSSKLVSQLGEKQPVPVEVSRVGREAARYHLADLVGEIDDVRLRCDQAGKVFITDSGYYIYDCFFGVLPHPLTALAEKLDSLPFVLGHGLFLSLAQMAVIGYGDGSIKLLEG